MRVLEIVSANDINGAVMHVLQLMAQWERRGHEAYLACPPHAWIADQVPSDRVIRTPLTRWPLKESQRVAHWARDVGIQVTHTHQSRAHSFGVLLRWVHGFPSVATAHNCRIQLHWALNSQVIGVSERTTRFHRRFNLVSRRQSATIENFVDCEPLVAAAADDRTIRLTRSALGLAHDDVVGVVVGSVMAKKGLHVLIEALPEIMRRTPRFRLLVVGGPRPRDKAYAAELKAMVSRLALDHCVTWTGPREDVPNLLAASDLFISASLEENFPISMLEAMSAGLPIVGTSVGGVPECVLDGETGVLVEPGSAGMLASRVAELANDRQRRHAWGLAGRTRVRASFSAESQMPKIEAVLAKAAGVSLETPFTQDRAA